MAVELLLIGFVVIVVVAVLARRIWLIGHRKEAAASITEEQARENAAPLTTAILALGRRENKGR